MKSITIHGLDDPLDSLIRQRAKKKKMSLNKTIKELLRESLGLESIDQHNHKKDFQDLFGVWTKAEARPIRLEMRKILLDTNAYSSYLAGDKRVFDDLTKATTVYMSIFVLGELYAGFKGGHKEKNNLTILHKFLAKPTVQILDATHETAGLFGMIKNTLKRTGTPLPINDIWISSHAIETGAVVITYDQHFKQIPGLRLWNDML
jgi:tRNA(fMet)-specific endonuclease VapC